jgi:predicted enzyme related to lactoylglutathione lyase
MIHHIAIVVNDLEKNKKFYREVFDLPEIPREQTDAVRPQGAWFAMGDVELHLQFREVPQAKSDQHFAICVSNLDSTCKRAVASGAKVVAAKALTGFSKRAFVYDFADNRIEVLEK